MSEHPETRNLLGPYVMGALSPREERQVEEHLEGCPACGEEERNLRLAHERLADLAGVTETPPPELKGRVVAGMPPREARRRIPSWTTAVAAAVCVLAVLGAIYLSGPAGLFAPEAATTTLEPTQLAPEAGGELRIKSSAANTQATLEVWNLPRLEEDEYYELWFGREDGRVSAGTFTVGEDGRVKCYMSVPEETVGGYERVGITLERFPEEPRMDSAKGVLVGELKGS